MTLCLVFCRNTSGVSSAAAVSSIVAFCLANAAAAMQVRPRPPVKDAAEVARRLWSQSYLYDTDEHATIRVRPTAGEPSFRMAYMPIRNRGELPRLILEEAQCRATQDMVHYGAPDRQCIPSGTKVHGVGESTMCAVCLHADELEEARAE